ncbi:MAG: efflux RND transporter permease subunit [Cyclobacteriaceae bacterium]
MNIAQFSIEKNRITFMVLGTILIMGLALYSSLSRDSMPPYTVRVANVITPFPGASPERVEQLVTDKVEKVAQELPELKEVTSTSRSGISIVTVTLKDEVAPIDLQAVWDRLRRKLDDIEGLPENLEPNLDDDGVGDVYGIMLGLYSDDLSYALIKEYADDMRDELIKLPDAAKVEMGGEQEERVFIEFDIAVLKEYGLTAQRLQSIIGSLNILSSGGQINLEAERIILEPTGNFDTIDDLKKTLIPVGDGSQLINLEDLTHITKSYIDPPKQIITVDGKPALALSINLKEGANVLQLGIDVDRVMKEWEAKLPIGLEVKRLASLDTYIDVKISDFIVNLVQAIAIVFAVMLIFLGIRTGSIIASLIPIVTIMTLMLMGLISMGLNQVTLAALIMALGMMVDNAIVVAETVMVKMEEGMEAKKAAIESCSELFTPLLISTLTTSAAFLAFYMAESTMGDIVGPIFVVISLALLSSWIISLSVITLFCYMFLKVDKKGESKPGMIDRAIDWLKMRYKALILIALRSKYIVLLSILLAFCLSLYGFTKVAFVFFPDSDRNLVTVDINLPLGTRIESTQALVAEIEQFISDSLVVNEARLEGVSDWSSYIGEGPESYDLGYTPDEANSSYAHMLVNTSSFSQNVPTVEKLDAFCYNQFADADIKVSTLAGGGGGTPIEIKVSGPDPDELSIIAEKIKIRLSAVTGTKNVKDDWGPKSKKFVINIDQARAQSVGITSQDVANSLRTFLDGFQTGEFREDDKSIPIVMRSEGSQQQSLEALETAGIFNQSGEKSVPLSQVAEIIPLWQYSKIKRLDINRTIVISSELTPTGNASMVTSEMTPWLDEETNSWANGYSYKYGGDAENTAENMGAVVKYLPLSGFIIVLLLVIQFNSFRKMLMVTATIPLGVIGVVIGLLTFDEAFGFMPFLGVISLAGIVINNAIVLIDRMEMEQRDYGRAVDDAVIMACLQRFRPILLATFTTVLGLLPLYLSGGEMWEGMAISIMVGLLFGTIITLLFIPSFFSVLYKVDYKDYVFDDKMLD